MMKTHYILPLLIAFLITSLVGVASETLSLDGEWEILFDHENTGRSAEWHLDKVFSAQSAKRNINVPSAWELIEEDYEGVAFYRNAFKVQADWREI